MNMNDDKLMDLKELTQFFSDLSDDKLFTEGQNEWLWHKLNIIAYLMKSKGVNQMNFESLRTVLQSNNNKSLLSQCNLQNILMSATALDKELEAMVDPVQLKMETIVLAEWSHYMTSNDIKKKKEKINKFSIKHIGETLNYVFWASFFFTFWFAIKDSASLFTLIQLALGFASVWILKILFFKAKIHMEEKSIETILTFTQLEKENAENKYYQDISFFLSREMKEANWTNSEDVNFALRTLKSQTLKLALLLDKKSKKNIDVGEQWHYVEKIWKKDIPLLLSNSGDSPDKNKMLKTTIIAMQKFLQQYIEDHIYNENIELTSKQKFWVAKASVT